MAKTFAITVAKQAAQLDAKKSGESSFTINNTSDKALRGQFKIRALGPAQASWFSLVGDAEREFASRGTQQVTVKVQIPDKTTPGTYTFRLDTISVSNPDDDFTEGPVVTVEVPAATAPPTPHGPPVWIWFLIGGIVLAIIIGVVLFIVLHHSSGGGSGDSGKVPAGLAHKPLAEVEDQLNTAQISFHTAPVDVPAAAASTAIVAAVKPESGQPLGADNTVELTLGMPDGLNNKPLNDVISELGPYGLSVQVSPSSQNSPSNQFVVVSTSPGPGQPLDSKNVTLTVASPKPGSSGCLRFTAAMPPAPAPAPAPAPRPNLKLRVNPELMRLAQARQASAVSKVADYQRILCNNR